MDYQSGVVAVISTYVQFPFAQDDAARVLFPVSHPKIPLLLISSDSVLD